MSEQIIITGATGFIGRSLVSALLDSGLQLTLAVRDMERSHGVFHNDPAIKFIPYESIASGCMQPGILSNTRAVVHLAGLAHAPQKTDKDAFFQANAFATQQIVENVRRSGIPLFVHMSSIGAITGNSSEEVIDDGTKPGPTTEYGRSKLAAESHAATLAQDGICAISLRPPLVVGHDAKGNWARLQRLALSGVPLPFGSIENRRSIVSIELLVKAILYLCDNRIDVRNSGNYCISDPETISLIDILTNLRAGMDIPRRIFPFPYKYFHYMAKTIGKSQVIDGITRNLIIDPSRFFSTFSIGEIPSLQESIQKSGQIYRDSRN